MHKPVYAYMWWLFLIFFLCCWSITHSIRSIPAGKGLHMGFPFTSGSSFLLPSSVHTVCSVLKLQLNKNIFTGYGDALRAGAEVGLPPALALRDNW